MPRDETGPAGKVRRLLGTLSAFEDDLRRRQFLSPCVGGGQLRVRLANLVHCFDPLPRDFEGWGIWRPVDEKRAQMLQSPTGPEVHRYLELFPALRSRLAVRLRDSTWLAYPANRSDARQRFQAAGPHPVHLVSGGAPFEGIVAHFDGAAWWFREIDRRQDPRLAQDLRQALHELVPPDSLRLKGATPETRAAYELAAQQVAALRHRAARRRAESRLREALRMGGGELEGYQDRGDCWWVEWSTPEGSRHTSAISKDDLTVVGAGICLEGRDRDFDLQSLVGVVTREPTW